MVTLNVDFSPFRFAISSCICCCACVLLFMFVLVSIGYTESSPIKVAVRHLNNQKYLHVLYGYQVLFISETLNSTIIDDVLVINPTH